MPASTTNINQTTLKTAPIPASSNQVYRVGTTHTVRGDYVWLFEAIKRIRILAGPTYVDVIKFVMDNRSPLTEADAMENIVIARAIMERIGAQPTAKQVPLGTLANDLMRTRPV